MFYHHDHGAFFLNPGMKCLILRNFTPGGSERSEIYGLKMVHDGEEMGGK